MTPGWGKLELFNVPLAALWRWCRMGQWPARLEASARG